ncbi:MAG: isoaspartyl peptidase/L-asparaginase [Hyphomonadaceae bacterium]|nr:isoaspartyl peptidase/L-asparaginase [Hyphomonadaceae bacterium]
MRRDSIRLLAVGALLLLGACATTPAAGPSWSIALHGGAGVISRSDMNPEAEASYRASLSAALEAGAGVLRGGGSALDAVETSVRLMEDDPNFNAGRGAVFTADGKNDLDASIMDGRMRSAGAVAGMRTTRHPISAARAVMEKSSHVMLAGAGADAFAAEQGLEQVAPAYFFTEHRWRQLEQELRRRNAAIPMRPEGAAPRPVQGATDLHDHQFGTVGVVARDRAGNVAAGTSTGGTTAKRWNRIGDSPIIGAGTYAQNGVCAVSSTGTGEFFIRLSAAREVCALIEHRRMSVQAAADKVVHEELPAIGGDGGVIAMDGAGRLAFSLNTSGMFRARVADGETPVVHIYADEE